MKATVISIAVAAALTVTSVASATCKPRHASKLDTRPLEVRFVKKPAKHVRLVPPVTVIDKHVNVLSAQVNREGDCVNGKFMDMVVGQLEITDEVVYARYYKGIGITCTHLEGYTFQNTYVDGDGVSIGNYAYFA